MAKARPLEMATPDAQRLGHGNGVATFYERELIENTLSPLESRLPVGLHLLIYDSCCWRLLNVCMRVGVLRILELQVVA